jgi:hypothetical protein
MNPITITTGDAEITIRPRALEKLSVWTTTDLTDVSTVGFSPPPLSHEKVLANGTRIPASDPRTDHVAVIDHAAGLMWSVDSLGDPDNPDDGIAHDHCIERCKQLRLLGFDDWRLPTRAELAALVDDTRHEPAIDTNLFPRVKPRWHWTSTAAAWSSASAWGVYFYYGGVYGSHRVYLGFALAVRRASQ